MAEAALRIRGKQSVSRYGVVACAYVAAALVLGGGGSPSPRAEIAVQLCFVAAALGWLWWAPGGRSPTPALPIPRRLLWLGAAILALPLVQLVPLPPSLWQTLPGRELEHAALALVGSAERWRPLSISPPATLAAFLALVPAVGAMWATASLGPQDRRAVLSVIAVVMLAGAALGAMQLAGSPGAFQLYEKSHRGWLTGFHANRNAAADVLLIGSLALAAWFHQSDVPALVRHRRKPVAILLLVFLALAVVLTGSRTGIALLVPVSAANWWLLRSRAGFALSRRLAISGIAAIGLAAIVPLVVGDNSRITTAFVRFDTVGEGRLDLWRDSFTAFTAWFPAGAGMGTFVNAFLPFERVDALDMYFPNRAHNDYLEFAIETGILAPLYLAAIAAVLGSLALRSWRAGSGDRATGVFAGGTLLVIALHSVVDYPLRNMAVACLAGVAAGLLSATSGVQRQRQENGRGA